MSKRAVHIIDAAGTAYNVILIDRNARMLCGKPLYYKTGRTDYKNKPIKAREATVAIGQRAAYFNRMRSTPQPRKCTRCFVLAKLTLAERAQALVAEADRKHRVLAKLKGVADSKKRIELEARARRFADAKIDALVCLDAFERNEDGTSVQRCRQIITSRCVSSTSEREERAFSGTCNLTHDHAEPCRIKAPDEATHVDLSEVLAIAVALHKSNHRSGGNRLIVFRNGGRACPLCVHWAQGDDRDRCGECGAMLKRWTRATPRDVVCRFCDRVLGQNCAPFKDYSRAFFNADGDLVHFPTAEAVNVWKHTVLCALRYLAGVETTDQDDAPVVTKRLPDSSFVLEHDR